jgi:hypothetical protein
MVQELRDGIVAAKRGSFPLSIPDGKEDPFSLPSERRVADPLIGAKGRSWSVGFPGNSPVPADRKVAQCDLSRTCRLNVYLYRDTP